MHFEWAFERFFLWWLMAHQSARWRLFIQLNFTLIFLCLLLISHRQLIKLYLLIPYVSLNIFEDTPSVHQRNFFIMQFFLSSTFSLLHSDSHNMHADFIIIPFSIQGFMQIATKLMRRKNAYMTTTATIYNKAHMYIFL